MKQTDSKARGSVVNSQPRRSPISLGEGFSALSTAILAALPAYALHRLGILSEWHVAVFALLAAATVVMDALMPEPPVDRSRVRTRIALVATVTLAACAGLLVVFDA